MLQLKRLKNNKKPVAFGGGARSLSLKSGNRVWRVYQVLLKFYLYLNTIHSDWLNYSFTSANSMHRLQVFVMVTVSYFLDISLDNSISVEERSKKKAGRHASFKEPRIFQ